jgi:hypothetical protein
VRVPAQLPADLLEGDALRVRVTEASGERVVAAGRPAGRAQRTGRADPPAALMLALPGRGAHVRILEEESAAGGGSATPGRRVVTLRYDSPALGRLDFVLDLDAASINGTVPRRRATRPHGPRGPPPPSSRPASAAATGRPATVVVREREEILDVRA